MKPHHVPRPTLAGAALALLFSLLSARAASAAEVNVTPDELNGWQLEPSGGSTLTFVDGPGDPPLGTGSAQLSVDAAGSMARLRNTSYDNLLLEEISALSYSTYVQANTNERAPYIALHIDHNNDGTPDDVLVFEPAYQDIISFPENPQGDVILDTWQTWNALTGGWYSTTGLAGSGPGDDVISLADYIAAFPDAEIINVAGAGGLTLVAGGAAADWSGFLGNADAFTLGQTTFDFELVEDSDNDGVPDDEDHCPDSDLRPFVDVGTGPTSVPNTVDEHGCSIQDLVNKAQIGVRNHGQYVSAIARLTNTLRKEGEITNQQAAILKSAAARSSIGKPVPKAKPAPTKKPAPAARKK